MMGTFLRDVMQLNAEARNFRVVGPDETASNRLDAVFEATTARGWRRSNPTTCISRATAASWRC